MADISNSEYFAARALEAREMSRIAKDPRAAIAHAEMAGRYEELALEFDSCGQSTSTAMPQASPT